MSNLRMNTLGGKARWLWWLAGVVLSKLEFVQLCGCLGRVATPGTSTASALIYTSREEADVYKVLSVSTRVSRLMLSSIYKIVQTRAYGVCQYSTP